METETNIVPKIPAKRGRKPKEAIVVDISEDEPQNVKKRGRKPRGGKIVLAPTVTSQPQDVKPNVILNLKCPISALDDNLDTGPQPAVGGDWSVVSDFNVNTSQNTSENQNLNTHKTQTTTTQVMKKMANLQQMLHLNNTCTHKSACFWCTCEFDNQPIYIPKFYFKDSYHVYGNFCAPECAVGYLMKENIDSSVKFERYHLLNLIYKPVYNYVKNIKPAPSPHYTLNKFCGNLSPEEYRSLFQQDRMYLVVDKPLTRIMPELHEDNGDFLVSQKMTQTSIYKIGQNHQTTTPI